MAIRVVEAGAGRVVIEAPLEPNLNHRSTAFGGSVAALAILAGWTLVHLRLRETGVRAHTVIQRSSVRFEAPIHGPFRAMCGPVEPHDWERFLRALTRRGRGRVHVVVTVESEGAVVASFDADYVGLRQGGGPD
jgi:thioesterase domain-containing protein